MEELKKIWQSGLIKKIVKANLVIFAVWYLKKFLAYLKWRKNVLATYPMSKPNLILGNVMDIVDAGGFDETYFKRIHSKFGEFTGFFLFSSMLNLSLANPEHVVELYKKTASRPYETKTFLFYLGDENLLFTHGEMAKAMRLRYGKMISNTEQLAKVNRVSYQNFGTLFDSWGDKSEIDAWAEVAPVIYETMGSVMFGEAWEQNDTGDRVYELHKFLIANVNTYMFLPWRKPFGYLDYCAKIREWRSLMDNMLKLREAQIAADPEKWKDDETALTLLLTSKDKDGNPFFSRSRMISTTCGFLNGAYDTTHATTFWMFYHLAKFPEVQEKLRLEIFKVLGSRKEASISEARQIEYLEAFIRESMRYKATVPVNQRINYEEDITVGGWKIPKGTCVNIPNVLASMNPDYYGPDVDEFRPGRFLSSDPWSKKAKGAWVAFGGYRRMCIGFTFALVELKAILISLLQRYRVELVDPKIDPGNMVEAGVNQPENHVMFRFVKHDAHAIAVENNLKWWGLKGSSSGPSQA